MNIKVTNFKNCDSVCYSCPLIIGEVSNIIHGEILIEDESNHVVAWPIVFGKFKALVNLLPGENKLALSYKTSHLHIVLTYVPLRFKRFLRLVYIVCQDDNEATFQALPCESNSVQSACDRISLAAAMLQSFTAEDMKHHNLKPKTFALEEENGKVICHVFRSALTLTKAQSMSESALWEYFAVELMTSNLRCKNFCKFLGILSFTRYFNDSSQVPLTFNEMKSMTRGYAALAAGGLALLGSACLHTWPQNLQEIPWRFSDGRKINRMQLMDESANRGFHWACYSSTLGATLHELGHIFDLGHTPNGIMSRGFDNIHKFFVVDVMYCFHPFLKKYYPHYQNSSTTFNVQIAQSANVPQFSKATISTSNKIENLSKSLQNVNIRNSNPQPKSCKLQNCRKQDRPVWKIPNPPDENCNLLNFNDSAHWARSSSLILCYHKWFNNHINGEKNHFGIKRSGMKITSVHGIRVIEFRDADGMAFSYLETRGENGMDEVDLLSSDIICKILPNTRNFNIFAEDTFGNMLTATIDSKDTESPE